MKNIPIFIFCLLGLSAFGQPQGVSMRSTNGQAFGATTHFRAASNYFSGPARIVGTVTASGAVNADSTITAPQLNLGESGTPGTLQITSSENVDETVVVDSTGFQFSDPINASAFIGSGSQLTGLPGAGPFTNTTTYGSSGATNYVLINTNGLLSTNTSAANQGVQINRSTITAGTVVMTNMLLGGVGGLALKTTAGADSSLGLLTAQATGSGFQNRPSLNGNLLSYFTGEFLHWNANGAIDWVTSTTDASGATKVAKIDMPTSGTLRFLSNGTFYGTVTATNGNLINSNSWTAIPTIAEGQVHFVSSNGTPYVVRKYAGTQSTNAILDTTAAPGSGIPTYDGRGTNTSLYVQTNDFFFPIVNGDSPGDDGGLRIGVANDYLITTPGNAGSFAVQGLLGGDTLLITNAAVLNGGLTVNNGGDPSSTFNGNVAVPAHTVATKQLDIYTNTNPVRVDFALGVNYFVTNAAFAFLAPANVDTTKTKFQTTVCIVTNSTAAAVAVTVPSTIFTTGTMFVTNLSVFTFTTYAGLWTNVVALPIR